MFHFLTYHLSLLKHLSYLSAKFGMFDAKNSAGCCPCHWRTTDCTSVYDTNFCPSSIFLHQVCTVHFVKHLSPYTWCISDWLWSAWSHFGDKNTITARCSSWENFSGNVAVCNVHKNFFLKWRHSHVVVLLRIKFPTKRIFQISNILKTNKMMLFCNLFIERPS